MRTYGLTMLPDNGSIVPVLMPFYTAEAHNSLEHKSRSYQCYMNRCPEGVAKAIGVDEASNFKLLWLSEPKVESSLKQPACTTAVDLVFKATV